MKLYFIIIMSDSVKNLGVTVNCHLIVKINISNLVHFNQFWTLLHYFHPSSSVHRCHKYFVSAFVFSRLDYCNSLLPGCPQYLLNKLQNVQNNAASLVLTVPKTDSISPHLSSLHWLPFDSWIQYTHFPVLQLPQLDCSCLIDWTPDSLQTNPTAMFFFWYFHSLSFLCVHHSLGQRSFFWGGGGGGGGEGSLKYFKLLTFTGCFQVKLWQWKG